MEVNYHMSEEDKTLSDIIQDQIDNAIQSIPQPIKCRIVKNYPNDPLHVDVELEDGTISKTLPLLGRNTVDLTGIILFLDGNPNKKIVVTSSTEVYSRLGLDQTNNDKFNHAIITKGINIEHWILSNAYYDYTAGRFVKIDPAVTSFGIMIQAAGTYPGEEGIDPNNNSIGIWRNPKTSDVYKDTTNYDYTDMETKGHIGCKRKSDGKWIEYGIAAGWTNTLMLDAYGGVTIGGAGLELDGNGIFPYTRLTSSAYSDGTNNYYLLGILDNAYHPTLFGWECDNNSTYSWFVGLKFPESGYLTKDNKNASFVVMYNDTPYNSSNIHELDVSNWHVVFEVGKNGIVIPSGG